MDLTLSAADEAFRLEVRTFLEESLTPELQEGADKRTSLWQDVPSSMTWQRILHLKGWVAPDWPAEYGGTGWSVVQRYIFAQECARVRCPSLIPMSLKMCGPMLIGYGTAEQKAHYLPRILSGQDFWCQGYSEPGSGSDLASLSTMAVGDGDEYVVNGTKIWTSYAQHANMMFALVRTSTEGKKQEGISFLLIDMTSPGITVRPIINIAGAHELNEVFFEDVRVPKANRVGEENDGWSVAKYLLEFERFAMGSVEVRRTLDRVEALATATPMRGEFGFSKQTRAAPHRHDGAGSLRATGARQAECGRTTGSGFVAIAGPEWRDPATRRLARRGSAWILRRPLSAGSARCRRQHAAHRPGGRHRLRADVSQQPDENHRGRLERNSTQHRGQGDLGALELNFH